jgi:hypothetical protein
MPISTAEKVFLIFVLAILSCFPVLGARKEPPIHGVITLEFENEILVEGSDSDSNGMLSAVKDMVVDSQENIYLLDWKQQGVLMFDRRGKFVKQIGQMGQGPSDISMGTALFSGAGNILHVYDFANSRMSRFTPRGEYIDAVKLKLSLFTDIYTDKNQTIFAWVTSYTQTETFKELVRFDKKGNREKSIEIFFREPLKTAAGVSGGVRHAYTATVFLCPVDRSSVAFGCNIQDRIRVLDTIDNKVRQFELYGAKAIAITTAEIDYFKRRYPRTPMEQLNFPIHRPFFKRIMCDEKKNVYVLRFKSVLDRNEDSVIDVYNLQGKYLYQAVSRFEPYLIRNGKMYVIDKNDDEETAVRKLSIKNLN